MSDTTVTVHDEPSAKRAETFRISWPQWFLGVIGLALSLYSYREFRLVEAGGSACGADNTYFSCDKVLASSYSAFHHIPLGIFGMVFFAIVIVTAIDTELNAGAVLRSAALRLVVATAGLAASLGMLYISFVLIKAMCPICIATHTASIGNFCYSLFDYLRLRRRAAAATVAPPTM